MLAALDAALDGAAALCIEDYNKGLLTADVCRRVIALRGSDGVPVFVDPAELTDYSKYAGATASRSTAPRRRRRRACPATTRP